MGKQKIVETSTAKTDVASPSDSIGKGGKKKEVSKPSKNSSEKNASTKNDGDATLKKGQKSEIDDIFSAGKLKKAQEVTEGKRPAGEAVGKEPESAATTSKRPRVEGSKDDIFGEASAKGRKRTEEGFPIYSEEELGLGKKGGDTDLCPFDCDCCF